MSASLRFLAMAVVVWAGARAVSLGALPGSEGFTLGRSTAAEPRAAAASAGVPAIVPTEFPAIEPAGAEMLQPAALSVGPYGLAPQAQFAGPPAAPSGGMPVYYYPVAPPAYPTNYHTAALPAPRRQRLTPIDPEPAAVFYAPIPQLDDWPLSRMASASMPARRSATSADGQQSMPQEARVARLDRLQVSAWALLRGRPGPSALATSGTLGGSQAGARLTNISALLAVSVRSSAPVGGARGGELAAGIRVKPFRSIPVAMTIERRHASAKWAAGARRSPRSSRAASISGRSPGASRSTAMPRPASSDCGAATCSPTAERL